MLLERAAVDAQLNTNPVSRGASRAGHVGDGGDARQRLASKSERGQFVQVTFDAQFAGGMATKCQLDFIRGNPVAVVGDQYAFCTAALDVDPDVARTSV